MNGDLKQVVLKPASRNKDGELLHGEYAAININVPIDSPQQEKAVKLLFECLKDGEVFVDISPVQPELPLSATRVEDE